MSHSMREFPDPAPPGGGSLARFWGATAAALAGWLAFVLSLQIRNPRLIPSWHGFLHTAIVNRFPSPTWVPENPFYAGAPIHYYWVYHAVAAAVARLGHTNGLVALYALMLLGLIVLVLAAAGAGRLAASSTAAGLVIGFLALAGVNPLGPVIAAGHHVASGAPLLHQVPVPQVQTAFVSDSLSDLLMTRPLLPQLYVGADWRTGQNLVWFLDISSRGMSLALVLVLMYLLLRRRRVAGAVGIVGVTVLLTAFNPIVGLVAGFGLAGGLVVAAFLPRVGLAGPPAPAVQVMRDVALLLLGCVLAFPTFANLLGTGSHGGLTGPHLLVVKGAMLGANFLVLLPLALLGARSEYGAATLPVRAAALAGIALLAGALVLRLERGNEHNIVNAASVLLALPAGLWVARDARGNPRTARGVRLRAWGLVLLFLPMTAATWIAFDGRAPLPLSLGGALPERTPPTEPVAQLYHWIREATPPNAVFVVDPEDPVKMSGNVFELPAFTGRTLFIGQRSYMTWSYPDAEARTALARKLARGIPPDPAERAMLSALHRPVYVIRWHAADDGGLGSPAFRAGRIAVYRIEH